ncbi:MAG: fumarylacetoacetate hydrolase family protein [Endomicrobia bacterium]|nr:fumarylacetoacetate hydrolase family protein [Endomicrobiia bacterium]
MTLTYYARVLHNEEEIWGILEPANNRLHKVEPSYLEHNYVLTDKVVELADTTKFLVPTKPTKIICLGLNFIDHALELGMKIPDEPIIFLKPTSALLAHKGNIIYPQMSKQVEYEGELAVVINKLTKNVKKEEVPNYILGFTCFNDVTARDLQKKDGQWTRAKSFDTFAPLGPWIVSGVDPTNLRIRTRLNGKVVQDSNTRNMIFNVYEVISFISSIMTLYPGDVITLGTPPGVGVIKKGDVINVEVQNIGELTNYVV